MTRPQLILLLSVPLILSLIIVILALSELPAKNISANIPIVYNTPRWQCNISCSCQAPAGIIPFTYEEIGTATGQATICANQNPLIENNDNFYKFSTNCDKVCKNAFPNNNDIMSSPKKDSLANCEQIGICTTLASEADSNPYPRPF